MKKTNHVDNTFRADISSRTHRSSADAFRNHCDYACAVQGLRRRAKLIDHLCWGCTAFLAFAVFAAVYRPGWFETFGSIAKL